jgi:hypothetical protein
MEQKNARHMRWHKESTHANVDVMVHSSDGESWKHNNLIRLDFALEPRNIQVAIATDGFNPFVFGAPCSCWPVFVIPLNMFPALCMKEKNILLSLVLHNVCTCT